MNNFSFLNLINTVIVKYKKDEKYYVAFNLFLGFGDIYGYTIFVPVNEKTADADYPGNEIYTFVENISLLDNAAEIARYIYDGMDGFVPGEDYFISKTLAEYISLDADFIMPEYIIKDQGMLFQNIVDYEDLSGLNNKDIANLWYFAGLNEVMSNMYSEEELNNFYSTFFKVILDNTTFTDYSYGNNAVYKAVMEYYKNMSYDSTLLGLNTILGSTLIDTTTNGSTCGCVSSGQGSCVSTTGYVSGTPTTGGVSFTDKTCAEKYMEAMYELLKQMLSDINFYCDWMYVDDGTGSRFPNASLIEKLIELIKEFIKMNPYIRNNNDANSHCSCKTNKCPDKNTLMGSLVGNCDVLSILENYINVLEWTKADEIHANKNKTYAYGLQFATVLPNIQI